MKTNQRKKFTIFLYFYFCIFALILMSCSNMDVKQYQQQLPKLDIQQYLNGTIKGFGIVQDRSGTVTKRFTFIGKANWIGNKGYLNEKIIYADGKIESRIWSFNKLSESEYEATTPEVIGKATIKISGNAMNWRYKMNIKVDDSTYLIDFDDWMFLMDNSRLINRNYFYKYGFKVGELTLFMEKTN